MIATHELALVGAVVSSIDNEKAMEHAQSEGVAPCHISDPSLSAVYSAASAAWKANEPFDERSLMAKTRGEIPFQVWQTMSDSAAVADAVPFHAKEIIAEATRKSGEAIMSDAIRSLKDTNGDPRETLAMAEAGIANLLATGGSDDKPTNAELADKLIEEWESPQTHKKGVPLPLYIDSLIMPVTDEFVILAARPSVGKTALAIQMMIHSAKLGIRTSMASLESARVKIIQRCIAQLGEVQTVDLRRGRASPQAHDAARRGRDELKKLLPLMSITDKSMDVISLRAWAIREKTNGSKLLIIDNLKHIRTRETYRNRFDQFAALSRELKFLRDDVGLPIIVLHHLNRQFDLAQSDDLERDADVVIIMRKDGDDDDNAPQEHIKVEPELVKLVVEKNREGSTGIVDVNFYKSIQTFKDI